MPRVNPPSEPLRAATVPHMLERSVARYGDRAALTARLPGGDRTITYGELAQRVEALAKGLLSLGVKKGHRCAILGPNSPEWAQAYLAVASSGAVCVPVDSLLSENEIRHILASAEAEVAFVAPRFLDLVLETRQNFPGPGTVVLLAEAADATREGVVSLGDVMQNGQASRHRLPAPAPEDLLSIIYTSGTTGQPKGVMLSHHNVVSDVLACSHAINCEGERFLSVLPLHHTFECTGGFLLPICTGSSITYARSLKSREILEDLQASQASVMLGVPLLFQKMLEGIYRAIEKKPALVRSAFRGMKGFVRAGERLGKADLGRHVFRGLRQKAGLASLRLLVAGGAPLMPFIPREFRRLGITLIQGYGLTEASPVLTVNPEEAPVAESIGRPLPGVEVRILDPDANGIGEMLFRGPMIMTGYYRNPESTTEAVDEGGWLRTGDLGYQDRKGYLYVAGRAKNLIVTPAGKNVYPEEIEAEINRSPFILESMVYGHRQDGGEEVRAVLIPDYEAIAAHFTGKVLSESEVEALVVKEARRQMEALATYKRVKNFVIRDEELPKTSTRKIKRYLFKG